MRAFFAAFLCLLASVVLLIPGSWAPITPSLREAAGYLIPILLVYIMAETALTARRRRADRARTQASAAQQETITAETGRLESEKHALQRDYHELLEEKEALQTALRDAQIRLKELQAAPGLAMKRDAQIDAEVVNLLALLQEHGRLVDFLMDDITPYQDAQVGAAARVVHQGCASILREYFQIAPIMAGQEGSQVEIKPDYDPARLRLVGKVQGEAPYRGTLLHHGWIVQNISLPRVVKSGESLEKHRVIAPAEVELA